MVRKLEFNLHILLIIKTSQTFTMENKDDFMCNHSNSYAAGTLKCSRIGTPKTINFQFVSQMENYWFLGIPIFKHIRVCLFPVLRSHLKLLKKLTHITSNMTAKFTIRILNKMVGHIVPEL